MSRATLQMRNFAKRLMVCEANGNKSAQTKVPNDFKVCEKLRPQLAALMGSGGFRVLYMRALVLARGEVSWLSGALVKPDGTLGGLEESQASLSPDELFEGRVVLLAQLLGLLVAFIGENLTLRLV